MRRVELVLAVAVSLICGCGPMRPQTVSEPSQVPTAEAQAEGDVWQALASIQKSISSLMEVQQSQSTQLSRKIEGVESLVQRVETRMYGPSPEQAEIEQTRLRVQEVRFYQLLGVLTGVLMIALAAPAVGGSLVIAFYVTGIALILISIFAPLLVPLIIH